MLPKYQKAVAPKGKDVEECMKWLEDRQLIAKKYSLQELLDDRFVR